MSKRIAIVVGHNAKARGAVRVTDGQTEYEWNTDLAQMIQQIDPDHVRIFYRAPGLSYQSQIDKVYAEVNAWNPACSVELHFNSVADPRPSGCLTLTSGSSGSRRLCGLLQSAMQGVLGNRDKGIRVRKRGDLGGRSLWQGRAPAAMTEPFFGSNAADCHLADLHKDKLADAIYRACADFVGLPSGNAPVIDPPDETPAQADRPNVSAVLARLDDATAEIAAARDLIRALA